MSEMMPTDPEKLDVEIGMNNPALQRISELAREYADMNRLQNSGGSDIDPNRAIEIVEELKGFANDPIVKSTWLALSRKPMRTEDEDLLMKGLNIALEKD